MMNDFNKDENFNPGDSQAGKLFIGGLSWDTTREGLIAYMSQYGEIVDANIKVDPATRRSRGFGFVVFKNHDDSEKVLNVSRHIIDGKIIDPKRAVFIDKPRDGIPRIRKIFVGGIKPDLSDEAIKIHFSQYGKIISTEFPIDSNLNRRRGFGFLEFENEDAADKAQKQNFQVVNGVTLEIKPAYTREQQQILAAKGLWPPPGTPAAKRAAASATSTLNAALGAIYDAVLQYGGTPKNVGVPGNVNSNPALMNILTAATQLQNQPSRLPLPRSSVNNQIQMTTPTHVNSLNNQLLNNMYNHSNNAVPTAPMTTYMPAYAATTNTNMSNAVGGSYNVGEAYSHAYAQPVYDYSSYSSNLSAYQRTLPQTKDKFNPY